MVASPEYLPSDHIYARNMKAIWRHWPELAYDIESVRHTELFECQPTRSGQVTCQINSTKGSVFLHSRYDPVREAEKWTDGVMQQAREQRENNDGRLPMCYLISGMGLGYHVKALFEKLKGDEFVIVSENLIPLLKTALYLQDLSEQLLNRRLLFITATDRDEIFRVLEGQGQDMMMGLVFTHSHQKIEQEFHQHIRTLLGEYASYMRSHMISLLANSMTTLRNIMYNLPTYVGTPKVNILKNRFNGYPAVVVSAGPSLKRNIHFLKSIRDQVVVIAVQTTLKPLLAQNIVPDFVTSLDYHPASVRFFEGLDEELKDIHLIAEPKASWPVIDYYRTRGPISLLGNQVPQIILGDLPILHEGMTAGSTVAHLAYYLALYLGTDPVIFIGQDLGFTDNVYYSPGNALHEVWDNELSRFGTLEMKEWERIVRHRSMLRKVPDIHDQPIYTDEQMFTYLQQFEKDFARCSATVIDASEGGVKKQFTRIMTLQEAAKTYCNRKIPPSLFHYRNEIALFDRSLLEQAHSEIAQKIDAIHELRSISEQTVDLITEMQDLVDNQPELNRRMIRLDELRIQVRYREDIYHLVRMVSQTAELTRHRMDRSLEIDALTGIERQRRQLQRDVAYVSEIKRGCDRMVGLLQECLERFDEEMQLKDQAS